MYGLAEINFQQSTNAELIFVIEITVLSPKKENFETQHKSNTEN